MSTENNTLFEPIVSVLVYKFAFSLFLKLINYSALKFLFQTNKYYFFSAEKMCKCCINT